MSYEMLLSPVELADDQLDVVAAGQVVGAQHGLVNVQQVDVKVDALNHNDVAVNAAVAALGRAVANQQGRQ